MEDIKPFEAYDYISPVDAKVAEAAVKIVADGEAAQFRNYGDGYWIARVGHVVLAGQPGDEDDTPVLRAFEQPTKTRAEARFDELVALMATGGF